MLELAGLDLTDYFPMYVSTPLRLRPLPANPSLPPSPLTLACPDLVTDNTLALQYEVRQFSFPPLALRISLLCSTELHRRDLDRCPHVRLPADGDDLGALQR